MKSFAWRIVEPRGAWVIFAGPRRSTIRRLVGAKTGLEFRESGELEIFERVSTELRPGVWAAWSDVREQLGLERKHVGINPHHHGARGQAPR